MALQTIDDFEDGDVAEWSVVDLDAVQDRVYEGSYAGFCGTGGDVNLATIQPYPNGVKADSFVFYFQETSSQNGIGVRFKNSNGNFEAGFASANSQQQIDHDGGITEINSGFGYNVWVKVEFVFDWANNQFTINTSEPNGFQSDSATFDLKQGVDFSEIYISDYNYFGWANTGNVDAWFDLFQVDTGSDTQAPTAPSNLSKNNVQTTQADLSWDASSDSGGSGLDHYNVYEDTGSGFSKIKEVSAGTTSTTITIGSGGASYDYYVTAVDGAGNESNPSNTVTVNYKTVSVTGTTATSVSTALTTQEKAAAIETGTTASSNSIMPAATTEFLYGTTASIGYGKHQYGGSNAYGVADAVGTEASSNTEVKQANIIYKGTDKAAAASSLTSAETSLTKKVILEDVVAGSVSQTTAATGVVSLFGIPDELSIYIDGERFKSFTDLKIKRRLNEIDTFEMKCFIEDNEDRQFIQENKEIKVFEDNELLFKGRLSEVEYKSSFQAECEGNGMADTLLNRKTDRTTYKTNADDIVKSEVSQDTITYGTIEDAPVTNLRFDHDNKARAVAGAANAVGYDWYIDQDKDDKYETDYLNFVEDAGSDTVQETYEIGNSALMIERNKDEGFVVNDITLLGRGDGINQLEARVFAATTRFTQLDGQLSESETGSFTVDDTSDFGSSGDNIVVRVGKEVIDANITDGSTLSINGRGVDRFDGKSTEAMQHYDGLTVWLRENKTQGIGPFTPEDKSTAEKGSSIAEKGVVEDRSTDKTIVDESTLEKVADRELRNRFEDVFQVQVKPTDPRTTRNLSLGDKVDVKDLTAMDVDDTFQLVGMDVKRNSSEEGTVLHLANRPRRLTERLSDIERDKDTLNAHMQGATNINGESFSDNADQDNPLNNDIYIPEDVVSINKVRLAFKRPSFRGYVQNEAHNHSLEFSITHPSHSHDIDEGDLEHSHIVPFQHGHDTDGTQTTSLYSSEGNFNSSSNEMTSKQPFAGSSATSTTELGTTDTITDTADAGGKPSYGIFEPASENDVDVEVKVDGTTVQTVTDVSPGDEVGSEIALEQSLSNPLTGTYHKIELVPKEKSGNSDNGRCRLQADVFKKVFIESTV